ncbi:MAG: 50S ribosomal protein L2 [Candidatus Diapherotrites archaeon]|jgi:large subunit ribosomal protein L2|nr:50S ribosomal protein L2 [Candidatus Diapherotrites archaeon]
MGKRLISQRRGKGSNTFKAKLKGTKSRYTIQKEELLKGEVISLNKDTGRNAILSTIVFDNGQVEDVVAAEGLYVGQAIEQGRKATISIGNVGYLGELPEGCPIFNIEKIAGDGGTFAKTAGSYALLVTRDKKKATIKMPSGRLITLPLTVRATVGNSSCGGKGDKPMVKAGNKFHAMKAKKKFWPSVRGVAMNAVDHPFGGAQHHAGKSKSTSRNAPPGRKVGAIASRRTGRRKK